MGFLNAEKPRRVELGDGYWADVRVLTSGEYKAVEDSMARARVDGEKFDLETSIGEYRRVKVLAALADWNLTDEDDQPLRVCRESLDRLPAWAFEQIASVVDDINDLRRGRDAAQFRDQRAAGVEVGVGGSAGVAGVSAASGTVAADGPDVGAVPPSAGA